MVNPMDLRNMQKMLKQMNTEQIDAEEVLIKTSAGETLSIKNPQVVKMEIMGQTTYQVVGSAVPVTVQEEKGPSDEDVELVMEKTGASKEKVDTALKESSGDIAEAIMKLKK